MLILSKYFKKQKAFIVKEELIKEIEKINGYGYYKDAQGQLEKI